MKYRLKKDLPFARAGEEVIFEPLDNIYTKAIADGDCYNRRLKIFLGTVEDLLRRGWIEEVKPREWNLWLDKDGKAKMVERQGENRILEYSPDVRIKEIIKVREVVE